jgi:hypothetical protein
LQGGANAYGGANFRAKLVGNAADQENLRALVTELPRGKDRWAGFQKLLDVMEATGRAPVKGSDTAFNQAIQREASGAGSVASRALEQGSQAGLGMKRAISDKWMQYRMGKNTEELAALLTDPDAMQLLVNLAKSRAESGSAQMISLRLLYMAERATAAEPSR